MADTADKQLTIPVGENDHSQGNPQAPLILVEYGDYECPYCGEAYPRVKRVQKELGENLRFVFRNFPLSQIHPHALSAAMAAEAAALQGKFWEMHDILFENQRGLGEANLMAYANALELDFAKFNDDLQSDEVEQRVRGDFMGGVRSGVNGTPTFFINGKRHNGSYDSATLIAALQESAK
jgi:protein-disulfide isomerase